MRQGVAESYWLCWQGQYATSFPACVVRYETIAGTTASLLAPYGSMSCSTSGSMSLHPLGKDRIKSVRRVRRRQRLFDASEGSVRVNATPSVPSMHALSTHPTPVLDRLLS